MKTNSKISNSLFWRISTTFVVILLILGGIYFYAVKESTGEFFLRSKQLLYKDVAHQVMSDAPIFVGDSLNENAVKHVMMHHMKVNPSCEVYILDTNGVILKYDAPKEKVKLEKVDLAPVKRFIKEWGEVYVLGNDPRNPGVNKVFSAAPIRLDGYHKKGYVYVILAGEEYDAVLAQLKDEFLLKVGLKSITITLIGALIIGLIIVWYLTKNLRVIEEGVQQIAGGNYEHQIQLKGKGELGSLAGNVNSMAQKLSSNIEELKALEKLRKELVANISHDLRTPVAIVHGYVETLIMKNESLTVEERANFLNTILKSTDDLEQLITDLFDLTKLESSNVELNLEPIDILPLLNEMVTSNRILAEQKDVSLRMVGEGSFVSRLDSTLFRRAVQNLIENAIKFTPKDGEVLLVASVEENKLKISINDTGVGIDDQYIPFVFDRYKKLDEDKSKRSGVGLGLAIVKKIFDLHDIPINVSSIKGQGTSFSFQVSAS